NEAWNVLRLVLKIGRVKHEDVAARMEIAGAQRVGYSAPSAVAHRLEKRILGSEALQHCPCVIHRAVVDDDHFIAARGRGERISRLLHEQRKVLGFVLGRDEDTDFGPAHRGLKRTPALKALRRVSLTSRSHTRLRIRAESTPSWSRYLATVRRAIWTPLSRRMLTIAWSLSGCLGSSPWTSFWSGALMPRAETSSPSDVASPDEKKNLSGSTPRGVCTNFSFVTRLTVDSCMLITSATSRSVSGFRYWIPFSKKSRCRSTM